MAATTHTVLDLFSGAGGMSYGFHRHPHFRIVGAVDAQLGKPSAAAGSLDCNLSYAANMGVLPLQQDLSTLTPKQLRAALPVNLDRNGLSVLCSCAPCTGFSRTQSKNHLTDDPRNSLVGRTALFAKAFRPSIILMENARELIRGNFSHHYSGLADDLCSLGYQVHGATHFLDRFGLPQRRERALVIAVRDDLPLRTMDSLWEGYRVKTDAITVQRAIRHLPRIAAGDTDGLDPMHTSPSVTGLTLRRLRAIPRDGGSWADLRHRRDAHELLTPAMKKQIEKGDFGSHPDVYGRLWWDRPSVTVKRECAHVGNGRYTHPEQDRLCTVREMALLQGFPSDYIFASKSLSNMYRHIGDAVPPLVSYQLAHLCDWIIRDRKPAIEKIILPKTPLSVSDISESGFQRKMIYA